MKCLRHAALVLTLAGSSACLAMAPAAKLTERFDKTCPLRPGGALTVKNVNGGVTVEGWDRDQVEIEAVKEVQAETEDVARQVMQATTIEVTETGPVLRVETKLPQRVRDHGVLDWLSGHHVNAKVDYHLRVPRHLDLGIEDTNGGLTVSGTSGKASLATTNGSITVDHLAGNVRAETTNGSLVLGDVAGSIKAETTNGGIRAELTRVEGDLSFGTTNGGISVKLPEDVRASLDASTTNGSVRSDFQVSGGRSSRRRLSGDINGGGGKLMLSTTNGVIRITSRGR